MKLSFHAVSFRTDDGDKCLCGVRLSDKPEKRRAASVPSDMTCDTCVLRWVRCWQVIDPDTDVRAADLGWPWEDPRWPEALARHDAKKSAHADEAP